MDVLTDAGAVSQHYEDVYELLSLLIWGPWRPRVSPIVQIAPALVPLLPRLAERVVQQACADEDPTA